MEISSWPDDNLLEISMYPNTLKDGPPSFCPILPAVETPTYNLSEICYRLMKLLKSNDYVTNDSFFAEDGQFGVLFFMASFDTNSLFINIPLTETLNVCIQNLYRNEKHVSS